MPIISEHTEPYTRLKVGDYVRVDRIPSSEDDPKELWRPIYQDLVNNIGIISYLRDVPQKVPFIPLYPWVKPPTGPLIQVKFGQRLVYLPQAILEKMPDDIQKMDAKIIQNIGEALSI